MGGIFIVWSGFHWGNQTHLSTSADFGCEIFISDPFFPQIISCQYKFPFWAKFHGVLGRTGRDFVAADVSSTWCPCVTINQSNRQTPIFGTWKSNPVGMLGLSGEPLISRRKAAACDRHQSIHQSSFQMILLIGTVNCSIPHPTRRSNPLDSQLRLILLLNVQTQITLSQINFN